MIKFHGLAASDEQALKASGHWAEFVRKNDELERQEAASCIAKKLRERAETGRRDGGLDLGEANHLDVLADLIENNSL